MRVLIANRGEIALRIQRACHELGVETVAAYSRADEDSLHLRDATDTVCISKTSYLDPAVFVAAALSRKCTAIHPGYGFLSESEDFARLTEQNHLKFIGPSAEHIALMGNKVAARAFMTDCGVAVLPGDTVNTLEDAKSVSRRIGFPLMLKASFGGGGMGIARIANERDLTSSFEPLIDQATTLFGSGEVYLEVQLQNPRHIELQVFGDGRGNIVHMFARDCSVQRRNQKLIEESPPVAIDQAQTDQLAEWSRHALSSICYRGAGTLEFLYADGRFYFLEMNTRIQVEHPVTEAVTGLDLVKLQIQMALDDGPDFLPENIRCSGHAIECRILAEDEQFKPSPGVIEGLRLPGGPGIRVDSHLYQGYRVSHHYDALIAKIISHGANRDEAIKRMQRALSEFSVTGISTNLALHRNILGSDQFAKGFYGTSFLDKFPGTDT